MIPKLHPMFTGLVQSVGLIRLLEPSTAGRRLVVERGGLTTPIAHGDSVCVSGVCLTAVSIDKATLGFDVITETLAKTKLGDLRPGDAVNLEPAVTPQQPLGGHFMQGHVDGVGQITAVRNDPEQWRVGVRPPSELIDYLVPKGSIAVDGVSLTLAAVGDDGDFEVALIPETLAATTLGRAAVGQRVNLEADILSKTVVHHLRRSGLGHAGKAPPADAGISMELLQRAGFTDESAGFA